MLPDWLQPRLGEPLPPALVAWAATQPSLKVAIDTCERADWRIWLRANNATTLDEQRRVVELGLFCARQIDLIPRRRRWWRSVVWPWYGASELARYWASTPCDDGSVSSEFWLSDFRAALVLTGIAVIAVEVVLYRRGWPRSRFETLGALLLAVLVPLLQRGWPVLRRAVNAGRLRRFEFARGWRVIRPTLDELHERASPAERNLFLSATRNRRG